MSQSMFTLDLIPISECWELLRNINLLLTIDNIPKKKKKRQFQSEFCYFLYMLGIQNG
jgi:hypothetical protein